MADYAPVRSLGGPRGKSSMYELGFRTPLIFNWPDRVPAGVVRDELVSTVDLFPTLLDFTGATSESPRSGRSLLPLLGGSGSFERETVIGTAPSQLRPPAQVELARRDPDEDMVRRENAYFLRNRTWRYIWYFDFDRYGDRPEDELYRIDRDPREARDVAAEHPELIADFRRQILRWLDISNAPFESTSRDAPGGV